ncbi:cytochrome P450 [Nocardia sp. NPDC051321]|uniref:cytochrome P450 n=1 Tax=Nocardia sp. NPDC051321 TaxID=3364323 RepID=UPI0037BA6954
MRDTAPVIRDEHLDAYLLTRHAECVEVLRNAADYATDPSRLAKEFPAIRKSIQLIDPPESTALRKAIAASVHAGLSAMAATVGSLTDIVVQTLSGSTRADRPVDLIKEFSRPLSLRVICAVLGVRQPDPAWFAEVSDRLICGMDYGFRPEALEPSLAARRELSELTDSWLDKYQDSAFFSTLLGSVAAYPHDVLANTVRVVLHAGYSSISGLVENLLLHLLVERDTFEKHRERLLAAKSARATAVDEVIRYDSPVQVTKRLAIRDLELAGIEVPRGATVLALVGAANRDPATFADPDRLTLTRTPNPHLGFGRGPHTCLGANLSIELGAVVLETFLTEHPHATLAARPVRRETASIRGIASLPVRLG